MTFDDVDLSDTRSVSAVAAGGNRLGGTLTPVVSDVASGAGTGTVTKRAIRSLSRSPE